MAAAEDREKHCGSRHGNPMQYIAGTVQTDHCPDIVDFDVQHWMEEYERFCVWREQQFGTPWSEEERNERHNLTYLLRVMNKTNFVLPIKKPVCFAE